MRALIGPSLVALGLSLIAGCAADPTLEDIDARGWRCETDPKCPLTANVECAGNHGGAIGPICVAARCADGYTDGNLDFADGCEVDLLASAPLQSLGTRSGDTAEWGESLSGIGGASFSLLLTEDSPLPRDIVFSGMLETSGWQHYDVILDAGDACNVAVGDPSCSTGDNGVCWTYFEVRRPEALATDGDLPVYLEVVYDGTDTSYDAYGEGRIYPARYAGWDLYMGSGEATSVHADRCD